ncbi:MAG: response regulator [Kineosporiaceae bacterium]
MCVRVLVVDDSAVFRRSAVHLLTLRGFTVLPAAADRLAAMDVVALVGCPDAALVDLQLPGDDGRDVAAVLRAACPSARIVLTSSNGDPLPAADVACCGATAFVAKDDLVLADLHALLGNTGGSSPWTSGEPA